MGSEGTCVLCVRERVTQVGIYQFVLTPVALSEW